MQYCKYQHIWAALVECFMDKLPLALFAVSAIKERGVWYCFLVLNWWNSTHPGTVHLTLLCQARKFSLAWPSVWGSLCGIKWVQGKDVCILPANIPALLLGTYFCLFQSQKYSYFITFIYFLLKYYIQRGTFTNRKFRAEQFFKYL